MGDRERTAGRELDGASGAVRAFEYPASPGAPPRPAWDGWVEAPEGLDRVEAVKQGWVQTRAKNRYLLWKDRLGRLEWHESRRIRVWLKKPANEGKALQLLANGFLRTGLIFDIRYFSKWAATLRFKGASAVIETDRGYRTLRLTCSGTVTESS